MYVCIVSLVSSARESLRICGLLLMALCIVGSTPSMAVAADGKPLKAKEKKKILRSFQTYLRSDSEKKRDKQWKKTEDLVARLSSIELEEMISKATTGIVMKRGFVMESVRLQKQAYPCFIQLPATSKKGLLPLIVEPGALLRGSKQQHEQRMLSRIKQYGSGEEAILLWPSRLPDRPKEDLRLTWERRRDFVVACVRQASMKYPVDTTRIYVIDNQDVWGIATKAPDLFAALVEYADPRKPVGIPMDKLPSLHSTALVVRLDPGDRKFELFPRLFKRLKEYGLKVDFAEKKGSFFHIQNIWADIQKYKRSPFPTKLVAFLDPAHSAAYWVKGSGIEGSVRRPSRVDAQRAGQNLEIVAKGCTEITVYLSSAMVNLDEPVVVNVNGTEAYRGNCTLRPRACLDYARKRGDALAAFSCAITVKVPQQQRKAE